jgi:hypothetical protein
MFLLILGCASGEITWAVQHASVIPDSTGLTGVQTWEFFTDDWRPEDGDDGYVCARTQEIVGSVTTSESCTDCRQVYAITTSEHDGDCEGAEATDPAYEGPDLYAITEVPDEFAESDPHPGDSLGWQVGYGDAALDPLGWAYAETLDTQDYAGAPGWTPGRVYTLWPAVAWEL